jgi:DNA-binding NtrC family response regulator
MRILLVLGGAPELTRPIDEALALRGHRVSGVASPAGTEAIGAFGSADLVIADATIAASTELVERVTTESPGTELVLIGPRAGVDHPDVIEHLEQPIDLERLLSVVDELADVLDGERLREPMDLVAYETLFAGDSPQIRDLLRRVRIVARSDAPVWVFGDDGSGRSIIARAIHDRSGRRTQPFLAFNCASYTDDELRRRLFEGDDAAIVAARTGSIFIERVSSSGPSTQRDLMKHLEGRQADGENPRLLIGIDRDKLADGAQQFTSTDLFYRLKVLEIEIPSLRERARDLEQIVGRMLGRLAADGMTPAVAADTMRLLERYTFPGNLLELAHALTHAYVLARGDAIQPQHLPISIRQAASDGEQAHQLDGELEALDVVAKRFERDYLLRVLRSVAGNRGRAAEILGLSRKGLWGKLKAHVISDDDIDGDGDSA